MFSVFKIKRVIFRNIYVPDVSVSIYLESGHLVRHTWNDCPYMLHINPLKQFPEMKNEHFPLGIKSTSADYALDERYKNDTELLATYIEYKEDRLIDQRAFARKPEVQTLLRDYIYCVLQMKPANVLEFTVNYFTNMYSECQYTVVRFKDQ